MHELFAGGFSLPGAPPTGEAVLRRQEQTLTLHPMNTTGMQGAGDHVDRSDERGVTGRGNAANAERDITGSAALVANRKGPWSKGALPGLAGNTLP